MHWTLYKRATGDGTLVYISNNNCFKIDYHVNMFSIISSIIRVAVKVEKNASYFL